MSRTFFAVLVWLLVPLTASLGQEPEHDCPLFPLYPDEGSNWVYYCDGVLDNCTFVESTLWTGVLEEHQWPANCSEGGGGCQPRLLVTDAKTGSMQLLPYYTERKVNDGTIKVRAEDARKNARLFRGYARPHVRMNDEWELSTQSARQRFPVDMGPVAAAVLPFVKLEDRGNTYYFKVFPLRAPRGFGIDARRPSHRFIGLQLKEGTPDDKQTLSIRSVDAKLYHEYSGQPVLWHHTTAAANPTDRRPYVLVHKSP